MTPHGIDEMDLARDEMIRRDEEAGIRYPDFEESDDPLGAARAIMISVAISAVIYVVLVVLIWLAWKVL